MGVWHGGGGQDSERNLKPPLAKAEQRAGTQATTGGREAAGGRRRAGGEIHPTLLLLLDVVICIDGTRGVREILTTGAFIF